MSLRAMAWALEQAPVDNPSEALLLIALADRASSDGRGSWPSVAWLAHRCRLSERQVQYLLRKLEKAGIIRRGTQAFVEHIDPRRRPTVWDLDLARTRGAADCTPTDPGVQSGASWGAVSPALGVQPTAPKPSTEPSLNQDTAAAFDAFWDHYPRRTGKDAARTAFARAVKRAGGSEPILTGLNRHRFNDDPQYRPHPATWLNQGRWQDEDPAAAPKREPTFAELKARELARDRAELERAEAYWRDNPEEA